MNTVSILKILHLPARAVNIYAIINNSGMDGKNSELKSNVGNKSGKPLSNVSPIANTDLVRLTLTGLALKNSELLLQGRFLSNRPDLMWYQSQLNKYGIKASLIQVHQNLKRLCRAGILVEHQSEIPWGSIFKNGVRSKLRVLDYSIDHSVRLLLSRLFSSCQSPVSVSIERLNSRRSLLRRHFIFGFFQRRLRSVIE